MTTTMSSNLRQITTSGVWVEYATVCPFSADNKWLLLQHSGGQVGLYTGDGEFVRLTKIQHNNEPRLDSNNPDLAYIVSGNRIIQYDLTTAKETIVHTFEEYRQYDAEGRHGVSGLGESDIYQDRLVLSGLRPDNVREGFVYSLSTGKGPVFELPSQTNSLHLTRTGSVVVGTLDGTYLYSSFARPLGLIIHGKVPHMDVSGDYAIYCSSNDPINKNAVVRINIWEPSHKQVLLDLPWEYGMHISACSRGFCVVSDFVESTARLWKVSIDTRKEELIATIPTHMRDYNSQPKASLSRDGSRVVFNIDDGRQVNVWLVYLGEDRPAKPVEIPISVPPPPAADELWDKIGALPFDESSDVICFNSVAKDVSVYRRRKPK